MISDAEVVQVHSVAEAYLFLMLSRCQACDAGPLEKRSDLTKTTSSPGGWSLVAVCPACDTERSIHFAIEPPPTLRQAQSDRINPTPARSRAIDPLGWLTLFQNILAESQKQTDRQTARRLACEAAQCLDEALKFYDADNELPDEDAFLTQASRRRFSDQPQHFAQSKWRQRRLVLPETEAMTKLAKSAPTRRWWHFW
jgi:hypothetical protein